MNAITAEEGAIHIKAESCLACGRCLGACPTGALEMAPSPHIELCRHLEQEAHHSNTVILQCAPHARQNAEENFFRIPCATSIDESVLLAAAAAGMRNIVLRIEDCRGCAIQCDLDTAMAAHKRIATLFAKAGWLHCPDISFDTSNKKQDLPPNTSRRALFRSMLKGASRVLNTPTSVTVEMSVTSDRGTEQGKPYPPHIPVRWQIMAAALEVLAEETSVADTSTDLWSNITVDGSCNGCGMCADFCPTGSLSTAKDNEGWTMTFSPAQCTGCGLCAEACYLDCLNVSDQTSLQDIIDNISKVVAEHSRESADRLIAPMEDKLRLLLGPDLR